MMDRKEILSAVVLSGVFILMITFGGVLGHKFGETIGFNKGKTMACQLNTTWIPPLYCYEITHSADGYRCCNWENTTLVCGRPLLRIR